MVLFTALGFAGSYFLGWRNAVPVMILAGLILAQLVPAKGSCSVRSKQAGPEQ